MNKNRKCNMERNFHGTCLNLCTGMKCSQIPNSLCMKYADNNEFQTEETRERIELAKELGLYNETCALIGFDIPCSKCGELVDVYETKRVDNEFYCNECC